jgi:hypothetical protein
MDIKKYLDKKKLQPFAIAGLCFLAVFIAGYGTGRSASFESQAVATRSLNYTTNAKSKPKAAETAQPAGESKPHEGDDCYIKGSKSKTYHIPGGAFYERTNPSACFASEEEAVAAGYKKSSR